MELHDPLEPFPQAPKTEPCALCPEREDRLTGDSAGDPLPVTVEDIPHLEITLPSGVSPRCAPIAVPPIEMPFGISYPSAWDSVRSLENTPTPRALSSARSKSFNSRSEPRRNMTPKNMAIWYFVRQNPKASAKLVCVNLDSSEDENVNHYAVRNGRRIAWVQAYQNNKFDRRDIDKRVSAIKTRLKKASGRLHTS